MKIIATAAASAIALAAASPAFAQDITVDQSGTNHSVTIDQIEDVLNSIDVLQAGDGQSATIGQRTASSANNQAFAQQGAVGGAGGNTLEIVQTGANNIGAVAQDSSANFGSMLQAGDDNIATIDQGFAGGAGAAGSANNARLVQYGTGGVIEVEQNVNTTGGTNDTDVLQFNDNNQAYSAQEDMTNVVFVVQGDVAGDGGHIATVSQSGDGNLVAIGQNSFDNEAVANQDGDGNSIFIDQGFANNTGLGSDSNYAEANQTGNGNTATINQNFADAGAGGHSAIITQTGNNNDGTINQSGDGHTATLTQTGDGFTYTIDQVGTGMVANIIQN